MSVTVSNLCNTCIIFLSITVVFQLYYLPVLIKVTWQLLSHLFTQIVCLYIEEYKNSPIQTELWIDKVKVKRDEEELTPL